MCSCLTGQTEGDDVFHSHPQDNRQRSVETSDEGGAIRVLSTQRDLVEALEQAQQFERRAIHECQRRLDHYDRCLQATRGGFARVLPFEWAIAVGSTGSLPRHAAALPEIEASSLALRLAIPERAASIAMDPGEDSVIAEQGPQPQGPVWAELGHADENEKTGVTGRLLAAVRWLRTEDHVRPPEEWDWKSQVLFVASARQRTGRAIWNPFRHRT